jgi:hypothetical protein
MACYAGFLVSVTLHLQESLGFSSLEAGLIVAAYASGFATASLTWTRANAMVRDRLPIAGPLVTATALVAVALIARGGHWPVALMTPLLFIGGAAHASAFSPLAARLTTAVRAEQAADLSGLILTASLIGQFVGVAAFVGVYLSAAAQGSAHALLLTTVALGVALEALAGVAWLAAKRLHPRNNAVPAQIVRPPVPRAPGGGHRPRPSTGADRPRFRLDRHTLAALFAPVACFACPGLAPVEGDGDVVDVRGVRPDVVGPPSYDCTAPAVVSWHVPPECTGREQAVADDSDAC